MTIKHEALRLFLAVTALILTAMLTNPNDSQESIGLEKKQVYSRKVSSAKKQNYLFFKKLKKRIAVASNSNRKTATSN